MKTIIYTLFSVLLFLTACTPNQQEINSMIDISVDKIRLSDNQGAIDDLTKVIAIQDTSSRAYFYRANAKFNLKLANEALEDYNKTIELRPDYADAYYNRAFCKQFLGDKTGACHDWELADAFGKPNVKDLLTYCD